MFRQVSYDSIKKTRLYMIYISIQANLTQLHVMNGKGSWCTVNHTSRAWTPAESRHARIKREIKGILTGMFINKMYTLGIHVDVITDNACNSALSQTHLFYYIRTSYQIDHGTTCLQTFKLWLVANLPIHDAILCITHHTTAEKTPAEKQKEPSNIHDHKKLWQKQYFDSGNKAREKDINVGDEVLIR